MRQFLKNSANIIIFLSLILLFGCKSYSKYTIDAKPTAKIKEGLLGMWKAVEDTDKEDYFLVQNYFDVYHRPTYNGGKIDVHDAHYPEYLEKKDYYYYLTRMDNHGMAPHYEQWDVFPSTIKNETFLNIPYRYIPIVDGKFISEEEENGYFFVRIIRVNKSFDSLTTAVVADTTLKYLASSDQVRARIEKNLNKPSFYSDTLHFYKTSSYHAAIPGPKGMKANLDPISGR